MALPSVAVPETFTNDAVDGLTNTRYCAADWKARLPLTVIDVPGGPNGRGGKVPPLLTWGELAGPTPESTPPLLTTAPLDLVIELSASSVPPLTLVTPL